MCSVFSSLPAASQNLSQPIALASACMFSACSQLRFFVCMCHQALPSAPCLHDFQVASRGPCLHLFQFGTLCVPASRSIGGLFAQSFVRIITASKQAYSAYTQTMADTLACSALRHTMGLSTLKGAGKRKLSLRARPISHGGRRCLHSPVWCRSGRCSLPQRRPPASAAPCPAARAAAPAPTAATPAPPATAAGPAIHTRR